MFSEVESAGYFINLLALSFILLPIYFITPLAVVRRALLSLAGAYLLYFIAPRLLIFYLAFWTLTFILHRFVVYGKRHELGALPLWLSMLTLISLMVTWKFVGVEFSIVFNVLTHDLLEAASDGLSAVDYAHDIIIPVGLSFASFRGVDLLVKSHVGQVGLLSYGRVLFYGFFPPVQIVGPIIEFTEIAKTVAEHPKRPSSQDVYHGLMYVSAWALSRSLSSPLCLQDSALVFRAYESMETL